MNLPALGIAVEADDLASGGRGRNACLDGVLFQDIRNVLVLGFNANRPKSNSK